MISHKKNRLKFLIQTCLLLLLCRGFVHAQLERWVYRYNGPGNLDDRATSIVYGEDGNIYAAGYTESFGSYYDFLVISLTPAGDTNWTYRYNGPGNGFDRATSIVYGGDGNIYAAGVSEGSETESDFTVISLTPAGNANWTYRYDGPIYHADGAECITYGQDGNIYAAGYSLCDYPPYQNLIVISLTPAGDDIWVYSCYGYGWNIANAIVYGLDGNVYVAGCSEVGTNRDFTVISFTPAGDTNWTYLYNGSANSNDEAYDIIYGTDGNIYAAGYCEGSGTSWDYTVISLDTTGTQNWIYTYDGTGSEYVKYDVANAIAYGLDGNIYAAGYSTESGAFRDFTVINLTPTGDTNWTYRYNGPGNGFDGATSIVYGEDGYIYAAGTSVGDVGYSDFVIICFTPPGDTNWVYRYNGPGNWADGAKAITYGQDGNIYAAGASAGSGTASDFTVISLKAVGIEENLNPSKPALSYLFQNMPNPFVSNKCTSISYSILAKSDVFLYIYNCLGQRIRTLVNCTQDKGTYTVVWDGKSDSEENLADGIYFYRLEAGEFSDTKKMLFLK